VLWTVKVPTEREVGGGREMGEGERDGENGLYQEAVVHVEL